LACGGRDDLEFTDWVSGNASAGGELLFGCKTYQMMEAYWTTPDLVCAERLRLPWVRVKKEYGFDGPDVRLSCADLRLLCA
jgi:hypothetical protein